jgi:hypothetical protein
MKCPINFFTVLALSASGSSLAQSADVSLPAQREALVESATKLWASRGEQIDVSETATNPFQFLAELPVETTVEPNLVSAPAITGVDLLSKLSAMIPASGTMVIGSESILLLGQKRLKVGDTLTITLDGRSYDLSLEAISSSTFSVRLGSFVHTRSTYISSSPRP